MGRVFGVLQAAFASFCISQRLLQAAGLLGAYLLGLCDCSGLLPGVLRQLCRCGMAQLLPLVVPLGDVCGKGLQLALQACVLAATGGMVCIQLFALVLQRFQFSLRALERSCSGRDIQRRRAVLAQTYGYAKDRYDAGYASYLEQIDAQRNLFQAEIEVINLRQSQMDNLIALYRALGGGWSAAQELPAEPGTH